MKFARVQQREWAIGRLPGRLAQVTVVRVRVAGEDAQTEEGYEVTENGSGIPTLELVTEIRIRKLLPKRKDKGKKRKELEASGVVYRAGYFYVVFDNFPRVARIRDDLQKDDNCFLGSKGGKRGYEGITYDEQEGAFHTIVEIEKSGNDGYCARIHTYDPDFSNESEAQLDYPFDRDDFKDDKGFEGLAWLGQDGCSYLLALCEGNRCFLGDGGKESSGGLIQVYKREGNGWAISRPIRFPETVRFKDYSGLDIRSGRVAVVSQEESKLWISTLGDDWTLDEGRIYLFPRTKKGKKKYCNVEGVSWVTDTQVVVVSDSKKGGQAGRCKKKAQSIHVFEIPD